MAKTLNQVVDILETIQQNHGQLNGFAFGQISDWDDEKLNATFYPFLFVAPPDISEVRGERTYDFPIAVATKIQDDEGNRLDAWSDLADALFDVVNHFRHVYSSVSDSGGTRVANDFEVSISPFTERFDNMLTGWETLITIKVDSNNNLCLAP